MDANNRSANDVSEHLRVQNEQLEAENKTLKKKIADQASQLKRLEGNSHLPPCPSASKPKSPVSGYLLCYRVMCRINCSTFS